MRGRQKSISPQITQITSIKINDLRFNLCVNLSNLWWRQ